MVNSDDAKVLSYDDIVVFQSDIRSLSGHSWLTDNIVNFAANYMKNVLIDDATKEKQCSYGCDPNSPRKRKKLDIRRKRNPRIEYILVEAFSEQVTTLLQDPTRVNDVTPIIAVVRTEIQRRTIFTTKEATWKDTKPSEQRALYEVCIVYASCCELIKYTEKNQLQELLSSFEVDPMKWNIFMFNDNSDPTLIYGGTHWSLIVFSPTERTFYLFDSSNYNVPAHIENFTKKLYNFCNPSEEKVHAYDCPKMNISGDCGIFAIEYLKTILLHINSGNTSSTFQFPVMNDQFVMDRRRYWRDIIYTLSNS